jgi:hypothetical protein
MAEWGRSSSYKIKYVCLNLISGKQLLRVHACLWQLLRFLVIIILSCMHMQETSTKTLYVPTSENIKRAHANTSIRGLANVVSSLMRSHARHVITMHVCTRTDNVASTRVSRGVPTGGGRIGRYAPLLP